MNNKIEVVSAKSSEIRILVFDCWLPGFLYIRDLAEMEGISLTYVHNSESQLGQPSKEYKDFKTRLHPPVWVKDFGEYNRNFRCLFDIVKPHIVLVTSMHYVEHRSALLFAKEYNVLRVFIPHGIFQLDRRNIYTPTNTKGGRISRLFQKLPRALYYTNLFWNSHFQRSPRDRGTFQQAWFCFLDLLFSYSDWQWTPARKVQSYYSDLLNWVIAYDESLKTFYSENSSGIFKNTKYCISGTLDTGKLLRAISIKPELIQSTIKTKPIAYYVSSPYPEYFSENGAAILAALLKKLKSVVISAGCSKLVYRGHPGEPGWFVDLVCELGGLQKDSAPGIEGLIEADLICGTSSSLMYNAILLEKPIVIISSAKIKLDSPYYEPLISYSKITLDLDLEEAVLIESNNSLINRQLIDRKPIRTDLLSDPLEKLINIYRQYS
jgi:hypothetical protein